MEKRSVNDGVRDQSARPAAPARGDLVARLVGGVARVPVAPARLPRSASAPHRARRREQEALAEAHVVFEQIDDLRLGLDPLGDQADAEAAEQVGEVGGMDVGARRAGLAEQQRRRHLDVADAALAEVARLDAQVGDLVDAEPEAELAQRREAFRFERPHGAQHASA